MVDAKRLVSLRLTAMAALCVSTLLTYDTLHPERAFCSLAESCERVRESPLAKVGGVPTSVLGMAAFGGLFLLTLLPIEWARRLLKPAGFVAALSGAGLFAYQALAIGTFCPLCLVADGAGLMAGLLTLTWGALPRRRSGRRLAGESAASRVAWTLGAVLAVVGPFAWPRAPRTGWVEHVPTPGLFEDEVAWADPVESPPQAPWDPAPGPRTGPGGSEALPPPPAAPAAPPTAPRPREEPRPAPLPGPAPAARPPAAPPAAPAPSGGPAGGAAAPRPTAEPPTGAPTAVLVVEYLNAFCAHCRVTHRNLARARASSGIPVRVRRVYTWAGDAPPLWARACVYAGTVGREDALFEELLAAPREDPREIHAAARRAGLDVAALQRALQDPTPPPRLLKDRELFLAAGLRGLPTLDIGRRRLMGEQSEADLRAALEAARSPAEGG